MAARDDLKTLEQRLRPQQDEAAYYERYYSGDHPLKFATDKFRQVFGNTFGAFADNWLELVVLASVERLKVIGFRFGDGKADSEAWKVWQANNLDIGSVLAHTEACKIGRSYLIVDPSPVTSGGVPRITVEHPAQVIVNHEPGNRSNRLSALKKWLGADGFVYANVYTPDEVVKFRSEAPQTSTSWSLEANASSSASGAGYKQIDQGPHGLGVVPVIPLYNNPGMLDCGQSDLKVAIPLTNAIDKQVLDMLIASEFAAYPQRVLIGAELPKDPETGEVLPSADLRAAVSRLWNFEDKDARVESLAAADLSNYVKPIEMLIQHLAAQTRTPPHYLLSSIINASGDALKAAEAGLVSKVEKKILDFSDSYEEAMRLAFKALGDQAKADATDLETIWADPEKKSEAERVDAAVKLRSIDVPRELAWERAGFSPKEIERMSVEFAANPPQSTPTPKEIP